MAEIGDFLDRHLRSIFEADTQTYHETTIPELTIYEWHVVPHRIDGLPFHDFMLEQAGKSESAAAALSPAEMRNRSAGPVEVHFDLANYKEQVFKGAAVCSYTMMISRASEDGVSVISCNESRVLIKFNEGWKVVHVHKSPDWRAPFQGPESS